MFDAQPLLPMFEDGALAAPAPMARKRRARKATLAALKPDNVAELRAARYAFLGLASCWGLSGEEVLRLLGEPVAAEAERHERLQALLGIRRSLQLLASDPDRCRLLLRQPDPVFDGHSPLSLMLAGGLAAIVRVRVHFAARVAPSR